MASWTDILGTVGNIYNASQLSNAASDNAAAISQAGRDAAAAAEFKPYAISTGFGTSFFNPAERTAGYELDPMLKAFRDKFYGTGAEFLQQVQTDPTKAAADFYAQQQGLMAPQRQAEDIALRQKQLQSGRIGLGLSPAAMGAGAAGGYVNPEQYQRDLARAQADAQLGVQSRELAQADIDRAISRGQGLFTSALGAEEYGLKPLTIGADIGNRAAVAGANQGQALLQSGLGAAQSNLAGSLASANLLGQGIKGFSGLWTGK
jgi:hypothetical protein